MALIETDFRNYEREKAQKRLDARAVDTGLLRQAAVHSQLLTGHPAWDTYLQRLQALLDEARHELAAIYETLGAPMTEERLRLSHVAINVFRERERVLIQCMSLPKEIVASAHDALDK